MKIIKSVKGHEILISDEDFSLLSLHNWNIDSKGYAFIVIGNNKIRMQRLLCRVPSGCMVDHINRNKLDNRRENLRPVTHMQNAQNAEVRFGTSKYIGVRYRKAKGKYEANANLNNKEIYIGVADTEKEAAEMRDAFVYRTRGEFAFLNFPENSDNYKDYIFKNKKVYRHFEK